MQCVESYVFGLDKDTESYLVGYLTQYTPLLRFVSKTWRRACKGHDNPNLADLLAAAGHVKSLDWARGRGMPVCSTVTSFASRHGRVDVLEWARENRIPFADWICRIAVHYGHLSILEWMFDIEYFDLDWVTDNIKRDSAWGDVAVLATDLGHLDILDWLIRNGFPASRDMLDALLW